MFTELQENVRKICNTARIPSRIISIIIKKYNDDGLYTGTSSKIKNTNKKIPYKQL